MLGIGGFRALSALGIRHAILHLNEGHAAFAILERVRERVEAGPRFTSRRMVREYIERFYIPALKKA